ncbi:Multidrug export protein MepA [Planctomycetes bacterium Pla163]|uniref:Multidrug-efflux transporter n=1 Tax=Rohdeia mirabilis TaxID=2528008 RepID=A0A518CZG0_9BACT|nr:Multidrug export protein MepA [Planctomycetes bacterium Pla163]
MSSSPNEFPVPRAAPTRRDALARLLRLAWPASLSYLLSSAYRINDQYWIQGIGPDAQSAIAAAMFVAIANFALPFLAAAGALSLVSRAMGAGDEAAARHASRHALGLAVALGVAMALIGPLLTAPVARLLALEGGTAQLFTEYLDALFRTAPVLFAIPVLDHVFIGRGRTFAPMLLQALAVSLNFVLNPLAIYGTGTRAALPDAPFAAWFDAAAGALSVEELGLGALGVGGAAWATGASRGIALLLGLWWLRRTTGTSLRPRLGLDRELLARLVRISTPVSLSIAFYAFVYWALFAFVLSDLGDDVKAGLGIGFQVFEGVAYPTFLGLSMAASSLIGHALGARDAAALERTLDVSKRTLLAAGIFFALAFAALAEPVAAVFSASEEVQREVVLYVRILALSQVFVAFESLWDKVLTASGHTRALAWIGGLGNLARLPLSYVAVTHLGWGAAGVWWAINLTTVAKAFGLWRVVELGGWRRDLDPVTSSDAEDEATLPRG